MKIKKTVLYNYGFSQGANQAPVREVVDAYYENGNFNFILVNYNSILTNTVFVSIKNNNKTIKFSFKIEIITPLYF